MANNSNSNSNSKSKSILTMPKNKNTCAVICIILLLFLLLVALYYARKNTLSTNSVSGFDNTLLGKSGTDLGNTLLGNTNEYFSEHSNGKKQMSNSSSSKPNLTAAKGECVIALFYADWCPHCVHFKPHFKKAMAELNGKVGKDGKKMRLEMVDCDAHKEMGKKYDVNGFPTVKLIKDDGTQVEYGGERTYEGLQKYLVSDN
jgi:thiol-disulfide isomerase/thioredoxin